MGGPPVGVLERLPAKLVPTEEALCHVRVGDRAEGGRLLLAPSRLLLLLLPPLGRRLGRVRVRVRVRARARARARARVRDRVRVRVRGRACLTAE